MARLQLPVFRQRGASRGRTSASEKGLLVALFAGPHGNEQLQRWHRYRWWGLTLLIVLILASTVLAELKAMSQVNDGLLFPLSKVEVTGDLQRLDHQQLRERLLPATRGGFFEVDVLGLRQLVQQIPWVSGVQISRRWPDQLVINISERQPLARWGSEGLLDRAGVLFAVERLEEFAGLPGLSGPAGSEQKLAEGLQYLRETLTALPGGINKIEVNGQDVWRVQGADGIVITFDGDPRQAPLQRLIEVYQRQLSSHWNQVVSVDLRYSDGVAVAFSPNTIKVEQGTRR